MVMTKVGAVGCRMVPTTCVGSDGVGDSWCTVTTCLLTLRTREGTAEGTGGAQQAGDKTLPITGPSQHILSLQTLLPHQPRAQHPLVPLVPGGWRHPAQGPSARGMAGSHRGLSLALAVVREL